MALGFERKRDINDYFNTSLISLKGEIDARDTERLRKIRRYWNFFEGYHWEELPSQDTPEVTVNYCRAFVEKFVAFELGNSFTIQVKKSLEQARVGIKDESTLLTFLQNVWDDNSIYELTNEIGQMKSVTGEAWVQVSFKDLDDLKDADPFGEYTDLGGRIALTLLPTSTIFPVFDPHDRNRLTSLVVMYTYEKVKVNPIFGTKSKEQVIYKQVWTNEKCVVFDGDVRTEIENKYHTIPFVLIKNLSIAGRTEGRSDLEDLIPLNTEFNLKKSNISEIIDYYSAPTTVVYGAKIGNLQKGANKVWGGLAKDARIENLELKGDLAAANIYVSGLKEAMCEVGGVPEDTLSGFKSVSNTSSVAMQYMNMPLVEKTRVKRLATASGIERINKLIVLIGLLEGLIKKPDGITNKDLFYSEVKVLDTLPKDYLLELNLIIQELDRGLETRENAMKRLGKENIADTLVAVDKERKEHPELFLSNKQVNSGFNNGETPVEQVRKEMTGQNSSK